MCRSLARWGAAVPVGILAAAAVFLAVSVGCGGGGGGGSTSPTPGGTSPTPTPTPTAFPSVVSRTASFAVAIDWAARSKAVVQGPSSALSAIITLSGANADGSDATFSVDRGASTAEFTQTYTSPGQVRVGTWQLTVKFCAQSGGSGAVVATAVTAATVDSSSTSVIPVTTQDSIASVTVNGPVQVPVGQSVTLTSTARDRNGAVVAVTPGSATYAVVSGGDKMSLSADALSGTTPGSGAVTATIDGITSAPAAATVTSSTVITVDQGATAGLLINGTQQFNATVTNAPNTGFSWSIQEGASGGSITSAGLYTAPATAGVYHVIATSAYDPNKQAVVTVTVHPILTITPPTATVNVKDTVPFQVSVQGTSNTQIIWSIQEGATGGAVTASGTYTAPDAVGTFHVVATSKIDSGASAIAAVTVQGAGGTVTIQ